MIGSIRGKITLKTEKFLIVEANGVGYKINVSPDTLSKSKKATEEISLWIHTHVREDAFDLYGFLYREELEFFEMLINVSGIGPKGALSILGIASIETLRKAISTGDTAYLTKISGIGRKTAEKIVPKSSYKEVCRGYSKGYCPHGCVAVQFLEPRRDTGFGKAHESGNTGGARGAQELLERCHGH